MLVWTVTRLPPINPPGLQNIVIISNYCFPYNFVIFSFYHLLVALCFDDLKERKVKSHCEVVCTGGRSEAEEVPKETGAAGKKWEDHRGRGRGEAGKVWPTKSGGKWISLLHSPEQWQGFEEETTSGEHCQRSVWSLSPNLLQLLHSEEAFHCWLWLWQWQSLSRPGSSIPWDNILAHRQVIG